MKTRSSKCEYRRRRLTATLILLAAVTALAIFDGHQGSSLPPASDTSVSRLAAEALEELEVKPRVSRVGYSRDKFSRGWATVEGCDMRNRILQRDLEEVVLADDNCTVLSGVLREDPFTGKTIHFRRGPDTSNEVQIEHLVAVSDAWQKGAQDLSGTTRHEFYNDPLNLVAVDGPANQAKGDADAASWLPRQVYRCRYVARQVAVKVKYLLWVSKAEYDAMKRVLNTCPDQLLPAIER